ncbi:uncharacterized protein A4U43_C05F11170 [Asparagus officinalis]|uniref:J domain-containing protein n=1 Tax=Asparagus officinalis TaxID=4686 RepID=A0A5P1EQW0_ASPOF|nr:dnaJ homolog subfamily B member 3-like [Asparagus officinalis]ONK68405.1 uncharacterized protein A4U43_C05F11170 [Asparagus officinalis]
MKTESYYAVLGIRPDASFSEIRSAYRKLAMKWHPDRWARRETPSAAEEAKRRFQQIQEAYQVLSDEGKRALYDAGLYDPFEDDEVVEGFCDFVQEMLDLMANVRKEQREYSLEELRGMLAEMSQGFDSVPPFSSQYFDSNVNNHSASSKRFQYEENRNLSGFEVLGSRASYC